MDKVCPFSMSNEPAECYGDECIGWVDNDCVLVKMALSQYYISKNLRNISDDVSEIREDIESIRCGR